VKGLKGRVALVTGATGLLGSAINRRLAAEGATVAVASRSFVKAQAWAEKNKSLDSKFVPVELDLSDKKSISNCLNRVVEQAGVPTVVVANASLRDGLSIPFKDLEHESFTNLFSVDVAGHVLLLRESVNLLSSQSASMIFLSSIYAQVGADHRIYPEGMVPAPVQYSAVKAAAEGVVRYLAALWGERGVRVNALVPGGIASEQRQSKEFVERYRAKTMLRRMASPDEVASAAAFLASDESSYMTGQCLIVDGGLTAW
jgi:NAD(P)-dependent dehydrogenase (short-subunit alcohol dehydrogenase family)